MNKTKKRLLKLISYKKINNNQSFISSNREETYKYPIHDEVLRELISGEGGIQKIEDHIERYDNDFISDLSKYKATIENGDYNPQKPYKLTNYYVKSETFTQLDTILTYKQKPDTKKNIVYVGDKGSGKTATQNCWIDEHKDILEKNDIFWVRCDGHKLYQFWLDTYDDIEKMKKERDEDRRPSLYDYFDLQFLYVFCKYIQRDDRHFFQKIFNKIELDNVYVDYPTGRVEINSTEKRKLHLLLIQIKDTISKKEEEARRIRKNYSYMIDEVLRSSINSYQKEKRRWLAISKKLQQFFLDEGLWILKIVDGVDNVHINSRGAVPYYQKMIKECQKFILERPDTNEIRLICLRERTYIDIGRLQPLPNTAPNPIEKKKITHRPSCFKKISDERYNYFCKNNNSTSIFDKIFQEVSKSITININDLHHNNARTFLYNRASLMMQIYYRLKQLDSSGSNIKTHVNLLDARNRFLNGRLYLDTFNDFDSELNNELGLCCMNIFYFNNEDYQCTSINKWYGLCKTRILQFLNKYASISESSLIEYLSAGIGYPESLARSNIDDLRAFGMIDSKNDTEIYYVISEKGKIYLNRSFSNLDTLYYCALDTPLPDKFIESGMINCHDNKFKRRTNFTYAAISTAITFIHFLVKVNDFESNQLTKNKSKLTHLKLDNLFKLTLPLASKDLYLQLIQSGRILVEASDPISLENINLYIDKFRTATRTEGYFG